MSFKTLLQSLISHLKACPLVYGFNLRLNVQKQCCIVTNVKETLKWSLNNSC